jgi:mannitol-1-phosphate 5-dehydrogenase
LKESNLTMNPTKDRSQIDFRKIVIFGAGKIGRSFIGQLFGTGGYKVVFADINPEIVSRLNQQGCYKVITKGEKDEEITVRNVKAILASDSKKVAEAVSTAGILAVSVGKNAIEKVIPLIASGLKIRYIQNPNQPLDIIIAENMIAAADFIKERLIKNLPADYPFDDLIGLIETSIGKMVPIMTQVELEKDSLMVYSEPYNTLILDGKAFKTPVPEIKGLAPKNNIKAWVDRKAFIHNLGHATAAYYGVYRHPSSVFMHEILDDNEVLQFTRDVMLQSADILKDAYPNDFTINELEEHIDDLLYRFRNKSLGDTIFRVGHDLMRKLSRDDRFMGAIRLAVKFNRPHDKILKAMSYGLFFRAKDNEGNLFQPDIKFLNALSAEFKNTLINYLDFNQEEDRIVIEKLKDIYETLRNDTVNQ